MVNFSYPPGILNGQPGAQPQLNMGQPVLSQNVQAKAPTLTGNARGSSRMPTIPDNRIGLGEGMLRVGGAMMQGANTGQGYSSAIDAYGNIMDYNRQADMERMKIEEERMLEEQRRQDLLRKMNSGGAGGGSGDPEAIGEVRSAIAKLQSARDMFTQDPDSSLTGFNWAAIASRLTGRAVGNEDEAKRLFLQEVRLDSVMQRVAQTKGAISNAEMQLFASQAPTLDSNDVVWKAWLDRQLLLQKKILNRLQNGIQVDPDAPLDADLADPNTSTVDQSVIDEANSIINGNTPDGT
jgi:hypothetical protein